VLLTDRSNATATNRFSTKLDSFTAQEFEKGLIAVQPQTDPFYVLVSQNSLFSIPITNILLEYVLYFNAAIKDIKILYHLVLLLDQFRFCETHFTTYQRSWPIGVRLVHSFAVEQELFFCP